METFLLTAADVTALLSLPQCIGAVDGAFRSLGLGQAEAPSTLSVHSLNGAFHIKAGILEHEGRRFFVAKSNGNFPSNAARSLPTIQGLLLLADADDGRLYAVMDSSAITGLRTAAATAVAARYLARPDARTALIVGAGVQGRVQLRALLEVLPISEVFVHDVDSASAARYAAEMSELLAIDVRPTDKIERADVCVTCTTSREFIVSREMVAHGAFVAGVGVDNESKRELAPDLLAGAKVVTDLRGQCALIGDLHHAIAAGAMTADQVYADLAEVVAGKKRGRESAEEVIVFDSTGIALQDVAAAIVVYESAVGRPTDGAIRRLAFA